MLRKLLFSLCIFFIIFYKYIYYKNKKHCFKTLENNGSNCLICFIGQTRAADVTWDAFKKHVLDVINPNGNTDIALSISKDRSNVNIYIKMLNIYGTSMKNLILVIVLNLQLILITYSTKNGEIFYKLEDIGSVV